MCPGKSFKVKAVMGLFLLQESLNVLSSAVLHHITMILEGSWPCILYKKKSLIAAKIRNMWLIQKSVFSCDGSLLIK